MPLLVAEQRTPEWLEAHRGRITSSTGAAVLGRHPDHGPLWAYQEIIGSHKPRAANDWMQWGIDHEQDAIKLYEIHSGNLVTTTGFWIHDQLPWLGASPDGLIGKDGGIEVKCYKHKIEAIPEKDRVQMQIGMAVCNRSWWAFVCWHPDWYFIDVIQRDEAQESVMLAQFDQFYREHIEPKNPPPRRRKKGMGAACDNIPVAVAERIVNNLGASAYDERLNLDSETPSDGQLAKGV